MPSLKQVHTEIRAESRLLVSSWNKDSSSTVMADVPSNYKGTLAAFEPLLGAEEEEQPSQVRLRLFLAAVKRKFDIDVSMSTMRAFAWLRS